MSAVEEQNFESLRPGSVLGNRFELTRMLGAGAHGVVFQCQDRILQTPCCVKVLRPESSNNRESRERVRREILLARRVAHRNCCQIFDLGIAGNLYYILMEYVDGTDLMTLIKRRHHFEIREALKIGLQICSALRAAHEANVIHRDLKPQNIMLAHNGTVKIMDFGIAKSPDLTQMTMAGTAVGTPSYMSPEQCKGLPVDPRSDLYSLGVVLFYMLTGTQPFKANTIHELIFMQIGSPPPIPSSLQPDLPPELDALLLKALAKEPTERFASALEMQRAISNILNAQSESLPGSNDPEETLTIEAANLETETLQASPQRFELEKTAKNILPAPRPRPAPAPIDDEEGGMEPTSTDEPPPPRVWPKILLNSLLILLAILVMSLGLLILLALRNPDFLQALQNFAKRFSG